MSYSGDLSPLNDARGLLGLPLVIVRMIFEDVHRDDFSTFKSLSLVSQDCRRECERLLFRSLSINNKTITKKQGDMRIFARLTDPKDPISQHVWYMRIGAFTDLDYYNREIAPKIEGALYHLSNLRLLDWNSPPWLPTDVVGHLEKACPSARLHVTNYDRRLIPLSRPLLSSPLLHTLDIMVYYMFTDGGAAHSEFNFLKNCLMHGGSVKVLRLNTEFCRPNTLRASDLNSDPDYGFEQYESIIACSYSFHWREGDRFPPLEELKLCHLKYSLSPEQCKMWTRCMDWSKLRKLDVGQGAPKYLFEALTGQVPQLKSLTFGVWPDIGSFDGLRAWEYYDVSIVINFLGSITALEETTFDAFEYHEFTHILPIIFEKAGPTLRVVKAICRDYYSIRWTEDDFMRVLESCYTLTHLTLNLKFQDAEGHWTNPHANARQKYDSLIITEKLLD